MATSITIGDLRKTLATNQERWMVNPGLKDIDLLIPLHPTGGSNVGLPVAAEISKLDLASMLKIVPNNPFLQLRRVELGILPQTVLQRTALPPALDADGSPIDQPMVASTISNTGIEHEVASQRTALSPALEEAIASRKILLPAVVPPEGAGAYPVSVDWRSRWGWPWMTTVQDQDGCNSCWAFAATALVETMVRINHAVWSKRSEGDVHDGMGRQCQDTGSSGADLDWIKAHGIADEAGYPYQSHLPYVPSADRSGRTVKIDDYTFVGDIGQQKAWLDTTGPLITLFEVWDDFQVYHATDPSMVYHKQAIINGKPNNSEGWHYMLVVGYDDAHNAWICKNSWGTSWGNQGYAYIGYGEANIDKNAKIGLQNTNPDPFTKRRLHSGTMIESGNGALHRQFEMMARYNGQVRHFWRDGSDMSWHVAATFGNDVRSFPAFTASTRNRNFEIVYKTTGNRLHHWTYSHSTSQWWDDGIFGPTDVRGMPSIIQGNYGAPANLELVVQTADNRLNHWYGGDGIWIDGGRFGSDVAYGGSLVQGRTGGKGNLELVCTLKNKQMQHWYRDDDDSFVWKVRSTFGSGVIGSACMIEGQYGASNENLAGHYELCCVSVRGQVQHWWYDTNGGSGWHLGETFGHDIVNVVALVEGSYGFNLEVIVIRRDLQLQHYWFDSWGWHEGPIISHLST